jgi:hypothetical protein
VELELELELLELELELELELCGEVTPAEAFTNVHLTMVASASSL